MGAPYLLPPIGPQRHQSMIAADRMFPEMRQRRGRAVEVALETRAHGKSPSAALDAAPRSLFLMLGLGARGQRRVNAVTKQELRDISIPKSDPTGDSSVI